MDSIGREKEERLVNLMRITVEAQDSSAKTADDATLKRFLRARDFNVQKASQFFLNYLKWRQAFVPLGYIPESEVSNELKKEKIFIQGSDKQGRPIGVILAARHNSDDRDLEEFKRLVVYGFDKISTRLPRELEKFTIIADLEGYGFKNTDIRGYLSVLEILQKEDHYKEEAAKFWDVALECANLDATFRDLTTIIDDDDSNIMTHDASNASGTILGSNDLELAAVGDDRMWIFFRILNYYPERLGKVLMIHVPYLFWAAWRVVYPFIDKVTKKKIIFVEDKHLRETLLRHIDESQLPEIYGGKLPLVPAQDCITANSPPVTLSNDGDGL